MFKLKKKANLTACFVCSFPSIQLFVLLFSSEVFYSESPVALLNFSPNFSLSWTYRFPINFCRHPLCGLLILTGGTPAFPAWMRKNELGLSCRCHKAPRAFGSCGMLVIRQTWKLARARWSWRGVLPPQDYFWCSQDLSLVLILTFPPC